MDAGGLGDRIATMPAIIYVLNNHDIKADVIVPDYYVPLARHFLKGFEARVDVLPFSTIGLTLDQNIPSIILHNDYLNTLRRHLVDYAFDMINDNSADVAPIYKNYPKLRTDEIDVTKFKLPESYVVLTPAFTAPVRALPSRTWNRIAKWLVTEGVTPVWMGAKAETIPGPLTPPSKYVEGVDYSIGIDLRDATTLLEAGKIIAKSKALVGVDNGLVHLAACTSAKIVVGFTSVDPITRLPYRNSNKGDGCFVIIPPDYIECKFRQTRAHFDYVTDYRECYCGYECVESLTAEKFIEELKKCVHY